VPWAVLLLNFQGHAREKMDLSVNFSICTVSCEESAMIFWEDEKHSRESALAHRAIRPDLQRN
ncbi:hypothetical protein, partial [Gluconobacter sp. GP1]|uniref:hypothetical protein n=1 Tax=Gluconobacter sp. GP1 TaxID=3046423 RepID=UPI00293E9933